MRVLYYISVIHRNLPFVVDARAREEAFPLHFPKRFWISLAAVSMLSATAIPSRAQTAKVLQNDPVYQALSAGNVYVDPSINGIDVPALQEAALQQQENPHTWVKIAISTHEPHGFRTPNAYAHELHSELQLGKHILILVLMNSPTKFTDVLVAPGLSSGEERSLAAAAAHNISINPTQGVVALANEAAGATNSHEYKGSIILWILFLIVVIALVLAVSNASRKRKAQLAAARVPISALRNSVLSGIERLDSETPVLPKNNPDSDEILALRQSSAMRYEQAVKILDRATELTDLSRAQSLLRGASADQEQAAALINFVEGKATTRPADRRADVDLPQTPEEAAQIPQAQRGVSFFSSRPAPLSALVPVTVTIGGQSRQVLVTPDEAQQMRNGQMPSVRVFYDHGQPVPWYAYSGYDPYNSYWYAQSNMWNGIAVGMLAADLMQPMWISDYNYGPYAAFTDNPMYQNYDGGYGMGGGFGDPGYGYGDGYANGGFDPGAQGYDQNQQGSGDNSGDAASADYGGGFDNGISDSSGGFDSGSSDYGGGFDSGSADFGGGFDSGGGGDGF